MGICFCAPARTGRCAGDTGGGQQFSLWDEWDGWRMIPCGLGHAKGWTPNLPDQQSFCVEWAGLWSVLPCEGRFWERKLGPAKAHYLLWLAASEEPHI